MTLTATPAACLRQRFEAHRCGDYAAIYASYHPQAPFLEHFPDLAAYEAFARDHLSRIQMIAWQCTMARCLDARQHECLQILEFQQEGTVGRLVELALLIDTSRGWRYHSAQKLDAQTLSVPAALVDFSDFDRVVDKVRF